MTGKYKVEIKSKKINYYLELNRNITIIKGLSSTGKTSLTYIINESYKTNNIKVNSELNLFVLGVSNYNNILPILENNIVIIDEGNPIYKDKEFANLLKKSNNYFILFTRDNIDSLPFSYKEVYEFKYNKSTNTNYMSRLYKDYENEKIPLYKGYIVLTEDSNSGYQFYKNILVSNKVISSKGKSNISKYQFSKNDNYVIIADGAAFGNEMEKILNLLHLNKNIKLFLPESFEYLLLCLNIFKTKFDSNSLNLSNIIDSKLFFSWESYFEYRLKELCKEININYNKANINRIFIENKNLFKELIKNDIIIDKTIEYIDWS